MTAQLDLFSHDRALARRTDPPTSRAAASTVTPELPELEALVLSELRLAGKAGMTVDELVEATGLDKVTVSPRLRPLCNKNLVFETGKTRPGKSGRQQTVWSVVQPTVE